MNSKSFNILLLLLISNLYLKAQVEYVITTSNDTIHGEISVSNYWGNIDGFVRVTFRDKKGKIKKKSFSAKQLKIIQKGDNRIYSMPVISDLYALDGIKIKKDYVKLVYEGEISLYTLLYDFAPVYNFQGTKYSVYNFYFKRKHDSRLFPANVSRKELIKYFIDCKTLVSRLKKKTIGKTDFLQMVKIYSECVSLESKQSELHGND